MYIGRGRGIGIDTNMDIGSDMAVSVNVGVVEN